MGPIGNPPQQQSAHHSSGRVVRWCWVNFQYRGVLLIWIIVGQGPIALAVGSGGGCLDIFSLVYRFSLLSPSLWETARCRMKYCLKGPLNPKTVNQPIAHHHSHISGLEDFFSLRQRSNSYTVVRETIGW